MSSVEGSDRLAYRRRLVCTQCYRDVKSVLRCAACAAIFPTSKLGPILISRGAFAFYALISLVVGIFWFTLCDDQAFSDTRGFPPPWSVRDIGAAFVVKDGAGQKLP